MNTQAVEYTVPSDVVAKSQQYLDAVATYSRMHGMAHHMVPLGHLRGLTAIGN